MEIQEARRRARRELEVTRGNLARAERRKAPERDLEALRSKVDFWETVCAEIGAVESVARDEGGMNVFFKKKQKKIGYPACDHLNNALRSLLKEPVANNYAISEICFSIMKSGGYFNDDVYKMLDDFLGKTAFTTREAAEEALKGEKHG